MAPVSTQSVGPGDPMSLVSASRSASVAPAQAVESPAAIGPALIKAITQADQIVPGGPEPRHRMHRSGVLPITQRDGNKPARYPVIRRWSPGARPKHIALTTTTMEQAEPIRAWVNLAVPENSDVHSRRYFLRQGGTRVHPLPPYGIFNVLEFGNSMVEYMDTYCVPWARTQSPAHVEAARLLDELPVPRLTESVMTHEEFRALMLKTVLKYDFGRSWKTGSAYIISHETLEVEPIPDDGVDLNGRRPLPRLITHQCDVMNTYYLDGLCRNLLFGEAGGSPGPLFQLLASDHILDWHIVFVILWLLDATNHIQIEDRYRHGRQNNKNGPTNVESITATVDAMTALIEMAAASFRQGTMSYEQFKLGLNPARRSYHEKNHTGDDQSGIALAEDLVHSGYPRLPSMAQLLAGTSGLN